MVGVSYISFPWLVQAFIITRVGQMNDHRVELSSHFSILLREIDCTGNYKGNGANAKHIREALLRLLRASVTFQYKDGGWLSVQDVKTTPKLELCFDEHKPDEDSLFGSYIQISEEFREAILRGSVFL